MKSLLIFTFFFVSIFARPIQTSLLVQPLHPRIFLSKSCTGKGGQRGERGRKAGRESGHRAPAPPPADCKLFAYGIEASREGFEENPRNHVFKNKTEEIKENICKRARASRFHDSEQFSAGRRTNKQVGAVAKSEPHKKKPTDHTNAHTKKEHRKSRSLISIDSLSAVSGRELIRQSWFRLLIDKASRIFPAVPRAFAWALSVSLFNPFKADIARAYGARGRGRRTGRVSGGVPVVFRHDTCRMKLARALASGVRVSSSEVEAIKSFILNT